MFCTHCQRPLGAPPKRACIHISDPSLDSEMYRRFTGAGTEYELICADCVAAAGDAPPLQELCPACFKALDQSSFAAPLGQPQIRERQTDLAFVHQRLKVRRRPDSPIVALRPVLAANRPVWVLLTTAGELWRLDLEAADCQLLFKLPAGGLDLEQPLVLHLDRLGRFAAVANKFGLHGLVVDLRAGAVTLPLHRESYHEKHCIFPLAFFEHEGRSLLVHATQWNRLAITAPASGVAQVDRPEHDLDYFHSELLVTPDQRWIADNGWNWHPVGTVATWSLTDWLEQNRWESEHGPSRRELCHRLYFWNGPLCWIDGTRLAAWGFGDDADFMLPAVRLFDVTTGNEQHWFPGPDGELVYDEFLYSYGPKAGTAVWDVESGDRLLSDPGFCPAAYHPGAHEFLSFLDDGSFRRTHLKRVRAWQTYKRQPVRWQRPAEV